MKKLLLSFPVLAVLGVLLSCLFTSSNPRLADVETLLASRSDSALAELRVLASDPATIRSRADRMYYYLMLADAANKCYDSLPTDSIMREVAAFYDSHGSRRDKIRAHYLLGCTYRDMGEAPQALQCYQDAVERADTADIDDIRLLMKVYGQMAEIYHAQNLPTDELRVSEALVNYSLLLGDTIRYIQNLEHLTKPYYLLGDTDRVVSTIKKCHDLFMKYGLRAKAIDANATLAYICIQRGQLEETRRLIKEYESKTGLFDDLGNIRKGREIYYYIKGEYYLQRHKTDSAELCFRKLQSYTDNDNIVLGLCDGLLGVYQHAAMYVLE